MRVFILAALAAALFANAASADPACEKRINDTKMTMTQIDAKIICDEEPALDVQQCMVDVLTRGKGRLKGEDFLEVYVFCVADPRPAMRDCVVKGLDKPWNDPGYKGVKKVGSACLLARKPVPVRTGPAAAAAPGRTAAKVRR